MTFKEAQKPANQRCIIKVPYQNTTRFVFKNKPESIAPLTTERIDEAHVFQRVSDARTFLTRRKNYLKKSTIISFFPGVPNEVYVKLFDAAEILPLAAEILPLNMICVDR